MDTRHLNINNITLQLGDNSHPIKVLDDSETFGILKISTKDIIHSSDLPVHILYMIDCSGSMSDICKDRKTKIEHIRFVLKNMITHFHSYPNKNISIKICAFDHEIHDIIEHTKITDENLNTIIDAVDKINPRGLTNFELALKTSSVYLADYVNTHPGDQVSQIFMSDGDITEGSGHMETLASLVNASHNNIFVGYGQDHNSHIMFGLGSHPGNDYKFIDVVERAGLIYGEIINNILNKALVNIHINTINCDIYDYVSNYWDSSLDIGDMVGGQTKIFHIRATDVDTCQISLICDGYGGKNECLATKISDICDLNKYVLRQRVQELIYESRQVLNHKRDNIYSIFSPSHNRYIPADVSAQRYKLKEFYKILEQFMDTNNLKDDVFMKTLCDDIYISNKSLMLNDVNKANMYVISREMSQGRQTSYVCNSMDVCGGDIPPSPGLRRSTNCPFQHSQKPLGLDMDIDEILLFGSPSDMDSDISNHVSQTSNMSPYISSTDHTVMRNISGLTSF